MNYKNFSFTNENYLIFRERETYHRTESGKSWKSKPTETESPVFNTPEQYTNFITSIPFFNGFFGGTCRAEHGYTGAGYLPRKVITISPGHDIKYVDRFSFVSFPMYDAKRLAGFREKDCIEHCNTVDICEDGAHKLVTFIHWTGEHAATFDVTFRKWVG
jgi:hypothetical protein